MEIATLVVAALGLLCGLWALAKAGSFSRRIEEVELAAKRDAKNLAQELESALGTQREMLALVASGAAPTREMILEGRLWRDVDGRAARELVAAGARVLDVRSPSETASGIIPGALLIPIDALESRVRELPKGSDGWLVVCSAGSRSAAACEFLSHAGFTGLHNLDGGLGAWGAGLQRPA